MASMAHYAPDCTDIADAHRARNLRVGPEKLPAVRLPVDRDFARLLSTLVEAEIIPRLMVAHAGEMPDPSDFVDVRCIVGADIAALARLVMQVDADALLAYVEAILDRGVAVETVMVDLLAPTARLLGEYWEDDRCDFVDVTMGLWRLQEVVHEIAGRMRSDRGPSIRLHRALFASMPGDQHSFGTLVIDEVFRRAGWSTNRIGDAETADLLPSAAGEWFDLIGLTISCDCHIADLTSIIVALRNVSPNPRVCIMVGGRIFSANPDLAATVGADGTARDAKLALELAGTLVREREREAAADS